MITRAPSAPPVTYRSLANVYGTDIVASLTIDVEWAHPDVLADTLALIDARGLRAKSCYREPDPLEKLRFDGAVAGRCSWRCSTTLRPPTFPCVRSAN